MSPHNLEVQFEVLQLFHPMSKFNQTCWEINVLSLLVYGVKNFKSIQDVLILGESFEVHKSNLSLPNYILMVQLGVSYLLHIMFVFNKIS